MARTSTTTPDEPKAVSRDPDDDAENQTAEETEVEDTAKEPSEAGEPEPEPEPELDKAESAEKQDADADAEPAARPEGKDQRRRLVIPIPVVSVTNPLAATMTVLTLLAALAAAWFGWGWVNSGGDDNRSLAVVRDEALRSGQQAIVNLNTLDYRNLQAGLKVWQDSSTESLYDSIAAGRGTFEADMTKNKTITSGKVLQAAITELDAPAGKATIIAAVQVTLTPANGTPTVKISRQIGRLTKSPEGWKLSALGTPPVSGT